MSKVTLKCESFRPLRRNTLCGFAEIVVVELRLRIKDVALHQKGNARWAQLPAKPQVRDGVLIKDAAGKIQYASIMEFASGEVREAFSRAVVEAVLEHTPTALDDGEQPRPSVVIPF